MNSHTRLENIGPAGLTRQQQKRLFAMVDTVFKDAIDARSPKKRPPGKAGLRAEKGYYRLLYLGSEFHQRVNTYDPVDPDGPAYNWIHMVDLLRQLADMPDLRSEILEGVESAWREISGPGTTGWPETPPTGG